jgi:hypothetical protein
MKENDPNLAQFGIHLPVPQAYTLTAGDKLVIDEMKAVLIGQILQ